MMHVASWRRPLVLVGLLIGACLAAFHVFQRHKTPPQRPSGGLALLEWQCLAEDPFEIEYGRDNLRVTRGYEGSLSRLQSVVRKALSGQQITVSAIGGSITKGHHVWDSEVWYYLLVEWMKQFLQVDIDSVNGAAPASGSDYFSFCFPLHIPEESDLVLIELAVNDEGIPEHVENMENLIRGIMELPRKPAVVLVEAMAFSNGGMGGGGGRMHLPVAQYYDVPVVNHRLALANHFARYPELVRPYFAQDWWGNPDTRHLNSRGHRDLGMLVASLIRDTACRMLEEPERRPEQSQPWKNAEEEELPGVFNSAEEWGAMPRMRVLEGWNPNVDHVVPPLHPTCLSTRATDPKFNLTPSGGEGWEYWVHPEHTDKPYLLATQPGAQVTFNLHSSAGLIKLYSLRSRTFGLGDASCWADDERERAVHIVGYWDNDSNIGRFTTIRSDLEPGWHSVTCELLHSTSDPNNGHEFRIISIMSL